MFPDRSYRMTRLFENFAFAPKDTVLAAGDGPPILMPHDGHVIFAPKVHDPDDIAFEIAFLSEPVRSLHSKSQAKAEDRLAATLSAE